MSKEKDIITAKEYLPEGFAIVPVEPSEEMLFAGFSVNPEVGQLGAEYIYKAMIGVSQ